MSETTTVVIIAVAAVALFLIYEQQQAQQQVSNALLAKIAQGQPAASSNPLAALAPIASIVTALA